jgi:hypothetical protein
MTGGINDMGAFTGKIGERLERTVVGVCIFAKVQIRVYFF